jgi:glutathione S-transferase
MPTSRSCSSAHGPLCWQNIEHASFDRILQWKGKVEMPTLIDATRCPFCLRVRLVLAERQIPHEVTLVDLSNRPDWLIEKNPPRGQVPIWEDGDFTLPESRAIMEYLEEIHPERSLLPGSPEERGHVRYLMDRFDDFSSALNRVFKDPEDNDALELRLGYLEDALTQHDYLAGDAVTLADYHYLPWLLRADARGVPVRELPGVSAWIDRCAARPGIGELMAEFTDIAVAQAAAAR